MNVMSSYTEKTKSRIGQARTIFNKMRNILRNRSVHLQHRVTISICYVFLVMHMVDMVTNEMVLGKMRKENKILNTIKIRSCNIWIK